MAKLKYVKSRTVYLNRHPDFDERWVQERIVGNPCLLGIDGLVLKDKERTQPRRGRLDLLLQNPETRDLLKEAYESSS